MSQLRCFNDCQNVTTCPRQSRHVATSLRRFSVLVASANEVGAYRVASVQTVLVLQVVDYCSETTEIIYFPFMEPHFGATTIACPGCGAADHPNHPSPHLQSLHLE